MVSATGVPVTASAPLAVAMAVPHMKDAPVFRGSYNSGALSAALVSEPTFPSEKPWVSMFIPVQLATSRGSEEAQLVLVNEALAAVLVRILPEPDERPEDGWFLQVGFGPCNREGLIFPTLEAAMNWTRAQFQAA